MCFLASSGSGPGAGAPVRYRIRAHTAPMQKITAKAAGMETLRFNFLR
jgi:hypothetical protein